MGSGASAAGEKTLRFNDSFTVSKELGSGAFSVVKLAVNKGMTSPTIFIITTTSTYAKVKFSRFGQSYGNLETLREVAVKIIDTKKLSKEDIEALQTEILLLMEIDHPNIIKLEATYDEGNDFYIVTELVQGGDRKEAIFAKCIVTIM